MNLDEILRDLVESTTPDGKYTRLPKTTVEQATQDIQALISDKVREALFEGMKRHTWMKDGVTYVGNGTYTLKDAEEMLTNELKKGK